MEENSVVLPRFDAIDQLVEFFDTHDMGDYAARMPEIKFEVAPKREAKKDRAAIEKKCGKCCRKNTTRHSQRCVSP